MENSFEGDINFFSEDDEIKGRTVGNSMFPLFRDNKDVAIVKRATNIKVNDVLLYKKVNTQALILHRVLKISEDGFITRGDNCYYSEKVSSDAVVGVMVAFERNGRYYNCEISKLYRLYIIYVRFSYPIRRLIHKIKSFIKVVKRFIKTQTARK